VHLIKQIQNNKGVITMASKPENRQQPALDPEVVKIVRQGMYDVVNAPHGTGKRGSISYALLSGKTGTAQWGPEHLNQNLAWFAGYFPHNKPKYAFAVLYEGAPNEKVSGGKSAAPMVPAFFNPLEGEAFARHHRPNRAMIIDAGEDNLVSPLGDPSRLPSKALIVEEPGDPSDDVTSEIVTDPSGITTPKALIVEDLDAPQSPNIQATLNNDPAIITPPTPQEGVVDPQTEQPQSNTEPAQPAQVVDPAQVAEPAQPVDPPKPAKAIPVE